MIELAGTPVAKELVKALQLRTQALAEYGITPRLALIRVGERPDDVWYENAATKRLSATGAETSTFVLSEDVTSEEMVELLGQLNQNPTIHGILVLRPLPAHIEEQAVMNAISAQKDVDGASLASKGMLEVAAEHAFAPCTAEAVITLLDHYGFEFRGANAVICGRSQVVGKPLANLLLARDATITIAHSKTVHLEHLTQAADLVITAMGRGPRLQKTAFKRGAWAVDVSCRETQDKRVEGDIDAASAAKRVAALSPVPGGVGPLTTAILAEHVIRSAESSLQ